LQRQPDDPAALLGRARAWSAWNRPDEATADYVRAVSLSPDDPKVAEELGECHLKHKQWDRAADVFVALAEKKPDRRETIVALYAKAGVRSRAVDFYSRLTPLLPDNKDVWLDSARLHAQFCLWPETSAAYARAFELDKKPNADLCFEWAALCLLVGDADGHRKLRELMLERGEKKDDMRPFLVSRAWTLTPITEEETRRPAKLALVELNSFVGVGSWSQRQRAAQDVRAGRFDQGEASLRNLTQAYTDFDEIIVSRLWLVLALRGQGKTEEARKELTTATAVMDGCGKEMPSPTQKGRRLDALHLHDWLEAQVLRIEAEKALKKSE
jgi:tetratricopeptide (TPR) repeat protein